MIFSAITWETVLSTSKVFQSSHFSAATPSKEVL